MRKTIISLLFLMFAYLAHGQIVCGYTPDETATETSFKGGSQYIANGGVFTPKGNLRVLVVFISYGEPYDSQDVPDWPVGQEFPNWATDNAPKAFYSDLSEFVPDIYSDRNRHSVSNFYNQMSNGSFKLMADYYPERVVVDVEPDDTWGDVNKKALAQIANNVDWSMYDNRKNSPNYQYDNSESEPDSIVDYIYFCHRFDWNWTNRPSDSIGGVSGANGVSITNIDLYDIISVH